MHKKKDLNRWGMMITLFKGGVGGETRPQQV